MKIKLEHLLIRELAKSQEEAFKNLHGFKRKIASKYNIPFPSNVQLLRAYHELLKEKRISEIRDIRKLLRTRPIRSLSGIVNVSVLTKPYPCPGKCIYCPKEEGIPKSYVSGEPAVERAKSLAYCPQKQVETRIEMLKNQGHPVDKIDLRIIGGTWSFYEKRYQTWFIKKCFDAANQQNGKSLPAAQKKNERSVHRIIGLSVETRPDFIDFQEALRMRKLGITKVELGVQSLSDPILKMNKRGHDIKAIIEATKTLKDHGFKVSYQMMLNLPGMTPKKDVETFIKLFNNPCFKPDFLKIYPCALLKETPLFQWYLKGKYSPYSEKQLLKTIVEIKKNIPYFVRIERIIRDIPAQRIQKGPAKISNLRQIIKKSMSLEKTACRCIRCREIKNKYDFEDVPLFFRQDYEASQGQEIFLSFESKNRKKLYSLLRMRIPALPQHNSLPVLANSAIIREIHTYGQSVPLASKRKSAPQHRGLGKKLIAQAEKIAKKEFHKKKMAVISAVGTRNYYRKLGYCLKQTYMVKSLS